MGVLVFAVFLRKRVLLRAEPDESFPVDVHLMTGDYSERIQTGHTGVHADVVLVASDKVRVGDVLAGQQVSLTVSTGTRLYLLGL